MFALWIVLRWTCLLAADVGLCAWSCGCLSVAGDVEERVELCKGVSRDSRAFVHAGVSVTFCGYEKV